MGSAAGEGEPKHALGLTRGGEDSPKHALHHNYYYSGVCEHDLRVDGAAGEGEPKHALYGGGLGQGGLPLTRTTTTREYASTT